MNERLILVEQTGRYAEVIPGSHQREDQGTEVISISSTRERDKSASQIHKELTVVAGTPHFRAASSSASVARR